MWFPDVTNNIYVMKPIKWSFIITGTSVQSSIIQTSPILNLLPVRKLKLRQDFFILSCLIKPFHASPPATLVRITRRLDAYFILVFTSPSSHLCIMCCFVNSCDVSSWSFTAAISVLKQDVISEESMYLRNLETFFYFNEMIIDKMNMFRLEISIWHNLSTSKHTDVIGKCSLLHSVSVN